MAEIHQWHGLKELEQNLKMLGEEVREKGVRFMMFRAAVPMREDAKRRAPLLAEPDPRRRPGTVRDAIKIWRKRGTRYAVTFYVGIRGLSRSAIRKFKESTKGAAASNPNDPFYWRWVELGTSKMAARPFLRPAFEAKKLESVRVALDSGREFLRRTVRRFKRIGRL